jgi:ADP-ribose pyrophosphatase
MKRTTIGEAAPDDMNERSRKNIQCVMQNIVYRNNWVNVYLDDVRFPNGKSGKYTRIAEREPGTGVVVLPLRGRKRLGLLRIYRYPIHSWQWEVPRGISESGQNQKENAERELREETGLVARQLITVGKIFPNSGLLTTSVDVFVARLGNSNLRPRTSVEEAIREIRFFSIDEITKMIKNNQIEDAFTLASLGLAQARGYLPGYISKP